MNNNAEVSPENWAAIEKMHKMGVQFVPASGRSFGGNAGGAAGKGLFYIRGYRLRKYYILDPDHIY